MKTIVIKVSGEGDVYWMENITPKFKNNLKSIDVNSHFFTLEEEGVLDENLYEIPFILSDLEVTWSYEGEDYEHPIIKKGKYIKTKEYLSSYFKSPFMVQCINGGIIEHYYEIELSDKEEFDPMKLQLVKSDYEVDFIPYGIVVDHIFYDGKKIECMEHDGYKEKCGRTWIYTDNIPYV